MTTFRKTHFKFYHTSFGYSCLRFFNKNKAFSQIFCERFYFSSNEFRERKVSFELKKWVSSKKSEFWVRKVSFEFKKWVSSKKSEFRVKRSEFRVRMVLQNNDYRLNSKHAYASNNYSSKRGTSWRNFQFYTTTLVRTWHTTAVQRRPISEALPHNIRLIACVTEGGHSKKVPYQLQKSSENLW